MREKERETVWCAGAVAGMRGVLVGGLICALLLLVAFPATSRADVTLLLARAGELQLARDPLWLALLHYHDNTFGALRSDADDERFFLDSRGKYDSRRELEATIRLLESSEQGNTSPQCRFIARYRWLRAALQISPTQYPEPDCPEFEEWRALLSPNSLTLVYPASYLNNPASAFGHTFLRIDAAEHTDETRLLAYGASYAAATQGTMGFLFAFKAIFGLYVGNFSLTPYYLQVRKYSDLENRDIWEYHLSFTPEEVERLVEHLWELRGINFDYYFFDENCASQLLTLLDVARPALGLAEKLSLAVIPIDTIRDVLSHEGVVTRAVYRPSSNTLLRARMGGLSPRGMALASAIARGERKLGDEAVSALPMAEHARVLELASEYLRYRTTGRRVEPTAQERIREHGLLLARSKLPIVLDPVEVPLPGVRPDEAHKTSRASIGVGVDAQQAFAELQLRPAFHEHIDFEPGYPRGAELKFLDTVLRKYEEETLLLERLSLVEIISLAPRNELMVPISWAAGGGVERYRFVDGERNLVYGIHAGPGLSYELGPSLLLYGLGKLNVNYSSDFDDNYALGGSSEIGAINDLAEKLRLRLRGSAERFVIGSDFTHWNVGAELRYALSTQLAVRAGVERYREFERYEFRSEVAFDLFF